jgi:hypothetical protein
MRKISSRVTENAIEIEANNNSRRVFWEMNRMLNEGSKPVFSNG